MTGADVKSIREALGRALDRRVSCKDLGLILGLAPKNAADTVRKWEDTEPTGPAAAALRLLHIACDDRYAAAARNAVAQMAVDMWQEGIDAAKSPAPVAESIPSR